MKSKVLYFIFGDVRHQNDEDLTDMLLNLLKYDEDAQFVINHTNSNHPRALLNHLVGPVNSSQHIFGAFVALLDYLNNNKIEYDHLCLVSANQYQINKFEPIKGVNYVQFYNCDDWLEKYTGKDFSNVHQGTPLVQSYGVWDQKKLHVILDVPYPMASNWEGSYLTRETIELCIKNLPKCLEVYPNNDLISLYPGYMALKTGQLWMFPPFFGTFDPSNRKNGNNYLITIDQLKEKLNNGYCAIKRVNYKKDCNIKEFVKTI